MIDYSDLSAFSETFEAFLQEKSLDISHVKEYHSLHGYGCVEAFEKLDTGFIDSYLQVNLYSHVYLSNYFLKLKSLKRLTLVSSIAHHTPTAHLQLY